MEFVCFRWAPPQRYRSTFGPETVNVLWNMIRRNYKGDCRLTVVTDDAKGISPDIRIIPLWKDHGNLPSPHGMGYPSCYRRLKLFSAEAAELIGERFVVMDLDIVITADITSLFAGGEDFKIWGDTAKGTPYNGSLWMLKAGTRRQVWDDFDPVASPKRTMALKYIGSDQSWIGACLGPNEPKWGTADGVYSYRNHMKKVGRFQLPAGARIVVMHGPDSPWEPQPQSLAWIRQHYR